MNLESRSDDVLQQRARLKEWAAATGSSSAGAIVNDLAEVWAAARAVERAIAALSAGDASASGKRLLEVQGWLYEELLDHAKSLRAPLEAAIGDMFELG